MFPWCGKVGGVLLTAGLLRGRFFCGARQTAVNASNINSFRASAPNLSTTKSSAAVQMKEDT